MNSNYLNRDSPLPLYVQIKQALLDQIINSRPEDPLQLPSESELMERFGVSRITVRRALSDLSTDGYIVREAGRGTRILPAKLRHRGGKIGGVADDLRAQGFTVGTKVLEHDLRTPPVHVATALGIPEQTKLTYDRRLVIANGEPIALVNSFHNLADKYEFSREEVEKDFMFRLLQTKYGLTFRRANRTMEAMLASADDGSALGIDPGTALLVAELTVFDDDGKGFSLVEARYRGDRYKYQQQITL